MAKVAVVTGANKGLGLASVKAILQKYPGSTVYLTSRNPTRGKTAALGAKRDCKGTAPVYHQLDIDKSEDIREFRNYLKTKHPGGIDVLVSNAGIMPKISQPQNDGSYVFDKNAVRATIKTGYYGSRNVLYQLLPLMAINGKAVIVSSILGQSFYAKCTLEIQKRFRQAKSETDVEKLVSEFLQHPLKDLKANKWVTADPGVLFHSIFRLGDIYPIALTHLSLAVLAQIYQNQLNADGKSVIVNAICPGRVKSDMNPTGIYTPEKAAEFVMAGVNLPDDTKTKGHFICQGKDYENWVYVPYNTGEGDLS